MVPCGLAGHMHCTASVSNHTLHLLVLNFLTIESFDRIFLKIFSITIFIYLFINFFYYYYGQNVDVIYIDFAKAFDKVYYLVTMKKLKGMGISGKLGRWLQYMPS